jgi:hypothetical protein
MELPDQDLGSCMNILARGSNEDKEACMLLDTSVKIPKSLAGVCIYITFKLLYLYCISWLCALPSQLSN